MKDTKANRALAASAAMTGLADKERVAETREEMFFWAGVFEGLRTSAGFLPSTKIDKEIRNAMDNFHDFAVEYAKEMVK